MNFIMILFYDIKRLIGHGRTAILAILLPIPVIILFSVFLVPMLSDGDGMAVSCALFMEEDDENFVKMIDNILSAEEGKGEAVIYPVKDAETGMKLVRDGKVAVYIHIPKQTYERLNSGEKVVFEYYYNSLHAMDAITFARALGSTCSVFGQGVRVVRVGADMALEKGVDEDTVINYWHRGTEDIIRLHTNRGRVLGWDGIFLPGGDFPIKYYVSLLFILCALFAVFPGIYLTSRDINELYTKRQPNKDARLKFFFARLISQALLIIATFCILFPVANAVSLISLKTILPMLPAILLISFCFSAFSMLIGSVSVNSNMALWTGFYCGIVMTVFAVLTTKEGILPHIFTTVGRVMPIRAAVSLFSNGLYKLELDRYVYDMLVVGVSFLIFVVPAFLIFRKRGDGR